MFRIVDYHPDGTTTTHDGTNHVAPPTGEVRRWIDLSKPTDACLQLLAKEFGFHLLALEDCAHFDQRPKVEEFGDHIFVVTHGAHADATHVRNLDMYELHAFLGERYLVTVHDGDMPTVDKVWARVTGKASALARGVDFVYYLLADGLVDLGFPLIDAMHDELVEIEDRILLAPTQRDLKRIFELRRCLVLMRKVIAPQRETMASLARRGDATVDAKTALYFRDVYDHVARLTDSIDANRDLLGNAIEAYMSTVSMRTNDVMKYLTLLSAVFLPLAFVVGFFGQNFDNLPGLEHWSGSNALMHVMVAICLLTPCGMLLWFKRQHWL
jgi:magnesium transporter